MDLIELQNDVDRDLKIDDTELDLESIRTVSYTHLTLPTNREV